MKIENIVAGPAIVYINDASAAYIRQRFHEQVAWSRKYTERDIKRFGRLLHPQFCTHQMFEGFTWGRG